VASIIVSEAALRSTRTLAVVNENTRTALLVVALASLLWAQVGAYLSIRRLIACLTARHWNTWISLGSPTPMLQTFAPYQGSYKLSDADKVTLRAWLSVGAFTDLHDPEVTTLAERCLRWRRIGYACALFVVACFAVLYFKTP
jgi:hypothetical protein